MLMITKIYNWLKLKNQTAFLTGDPSHKNGIIQKHLEE
jgi:hypothetical protein